MKAAMEKAAKRLAIERYRQKSEMMIPIRKHLQWLGLTGLSEFEGRQVLSIYRRMRLHLKACSCPRMDLLWTRQGRWRWRLIGDPVQADYAAQLAPGDEPWCELSLMRTNDSRFFVGSYVGSVGPGAWPALFELSASAHRTGVGWARLTLDACTIFEVFE